MSAKRDALLQKVEQGERVAEIRDALGLSGEAFATLLQKRLHALGVGRNYDKFKVSRMESGGRKLTIEEAAVIADLDPSKRGAVWLVFGDKRIRGTLPRSKGGDAREA